MSGRLEKAAPYHHSVQLNIMYAVNKKYRKKEIAISFFCFKKKKNSHQHFASDYLPAEFTEDNRAFENESLNQLYDAIRQLSEIDRAVILLYLEEKSYKEIADITGSNTNNIGVRIKRIKERLKKILDGKVN